MHGVEGAGGVAAVEQLPEEDEEDGELAVQRGDTGPFAGERHVGGAGHGGDGRVVDDVGDCVEHGVVGAEDHCGRHPGGEKRREQDGGGEVEVHHGLCGARAR